MNNTTQEIVDSQEKTLQKNKLILRIAEYGYHKAVYGIMAAKQESEQNRFETLAEGDFEEIKKIIGEI